MACVWRAATVLAVCILVCIFPGATAYAWFNDVTDSYPASQDVPVSGSALTGADVPEGVYNITATTSSYMCKLSNVTLTSAGGGLWATFTMSGAYNALYPGTAEEAAASTNEDGTDISAYYVTEPLEGYTQRQFSIPINALNEQMTLATYSGGSKGIDGGMWYTRTVVFNSSSEVDDAIAGGGDDQDEGGDDTPSDDSGGSDDDSGYDPGDSDGGDSQDDGASGDESSGDDASADDGSAGDSEEEDTDSESKSSSSPASNTPSGGTANNSDNSNDAADEGEGNSGEEENPSDEAASSESAAAKDEKANGGARMKEITFAGNQVVELGEGVDPELQQQEKERNDVQNAGMVAAGALGAVNVALVGAYVVGLRRTKPQMFAKAAKRISRFRRKG